MKFDELKVKRKAGNFKPQRCWISQCKRLILFGCDRQNIPRFAVATREYSTHERPLYLEKKESNVGLIVMRDQQELHEDTYDIFVKAQVELPDTCIEAAEQH